MNGCSHERKTQLGSTTVTYHNNTVHWGVDDADADVGKIEGIILELSLRIEKLLLCIHHLQRSADVWVPGSEGGR